MSSTLMLCFQNRKDKLIKMERRLRRWCWFWRSIM